ncbi:hypothetical protein OAL97_00710 [Paracoccaceae bacterium]|nr:hypothetical protein [Paracoccaceae bacterium]
MTVFGDIAGKNGASLCQMGWPVFAHHILTHQDIHQTIGLIRRENLNHFLILENIISPGD